MPLVESYLDGPVGTLVMNYPERRNALGAVFISEFITGLHSLLRARARVVVVRALDGAGAWSAGHDISELAGGDPLAPDQPLPRLLREVEKCPVPILAMIDAGAYGGAVELALTCDLRVGSERASFTMPPARLALPYSAEGLARFIRVLGLATTQELFFTARTADAERSVRVGLLTYLVPSVELEVFTQQLAEKIARNSPRCIRALKASLRLLSEAAPLPTKNIEQINALRRHVLASHDYQEGLEAFRLKRRPVFEDI